MGGVLFPHRHTRDLGEAMAERCEADVEWIQDRDARRGLRG